jgi:hypothetical protein
MNLNGGKRARAWGVGSREWDPRTAAALYERLPEGVIACRRDSENLVFNRRARELFEGAGGEDVEPDMCAEHYGLYTRDGERLLEMDEIPLQRALRGEVLRDVLVGVPPGAGRTGS